MTNFSAVSKSIYGWLLKKASNLWVLVKSHKTISILSPIGIITLIFMIYQHYEAQKIVLRLTVKPLYEENIFFYPPKGESQGDSKHANFSEICGTDFPRIAFPIKIRIANLSNNTAVLQSGWHTNNVCGKNKKQAALLPVRLSDGYDSKKSHIYELIKATDYPLTVPANTENIYYSVSYIDLTSQEAHLLLNLLGEEGYIEEKSLLEIKGFNLLTLSLYASYFAEVPCLVPCMYEHLAGLVARSYAYIFKIDNGDLVGSLVIPVMDRIRLSAYIFNGSDPFTQCNPKEIEECWPEIKICGGDPTCDRVIEEYGYLKEILKGRQLLIRDLDLSEASQKAGQ